MKSKSIPMTLIMSGIMSVSVSVCNNRPNLPFRAIPDCKLGSMTANRLG